MPRRVDANQKTIVEAIRKYGASVRHTHEVSKGFPDILIGYRGGNHLVEIKDGSKPPSKQALTEQEKHFFETWQGQVILLNSVESALDFLAQIDLKHGVNLS